MYGERHVSIYVFAERRIEGLPETTFSRRMQITFMCPLVRVSVLSKNNLMRFRNLGRVSLSDGDAPIRESIVELMKKHGLPDERTNHSLRVADLALQISDLMTDDNIELDKRVIEKGALLHDVGYLHCKGEPVEIPEWRVYGIKIPSDDINHPTIGEAIVRKWGFSEEVSDCVLRHNIGGFTVEECILLKVSPVPEKDCTPMTYEEKVVHYADHLMLLDRLKLDPLKDPQASAKACLPWLNYYFIKRANRKLEIDDPIPQREVRLNNELKKYLKALRHPRQESKSGEHS